MGSSRPRDQTRVSNIAGKLFAIWAIKESLDFEREAPLREERPPWADLDESYYYPDNLRSIKIMEELRFLWVTRVCYYSFLKYTYTGVNSQNSILASHML